VFRTPLRLGRPAAVLLALTLAAAGCGGDGGSSGGAVSGIATTTTTTTTAAPAPSSIVSLSATATEILFAIGAGDQVVAVDDQSTYPAEAPMSALSGFTPNVESIAGYDPDLVVISYDPGDLVVGLTALGIGVLMQGAANAIDDTYAQIAELGDMTGHADEAAALNESIADELAALAEGQPGAGLTYFHEIDATLYTATSSTFLGQLYAMLGLENIADPADEDGWGYPQLSPEYVIDVDPNLIFLADAEWGESAETVAARPGWDTMTAVQAGNVFPLDETAGRWGPRIVDFLATVKAAVEEATG
jgi:iron complex transport system substrate-binding protein